MDVCTMHILDAMMDYIAKLSEDPRNAVIILTGLTRQKLGETFKDLKNVTLVTSNGLVYSWAANLLVEHKCQQLGAPSAPNTKVLSNEDAAALGAGPDEDGRVWECMECNVNWNDVAAIAAPIISRFTFRTNGTCQTPRFPGIGWSFFGADPEWGQKQALQLSLELEAALVNHDVMVTSLIPGSIEVVPRTLHKGLIVTKALERIMLARAGKLPGLLMVVTGEENDDGMTQAALGIIRDVPSQSDFHKIKIFTVTVSKRESPSQFYVNDVNDVENLLKALLQQS